MVPATAEEKANAATVKHFLESKKAIVTKLWWQRFARAKIGASKDMFDELVQKGFFLSTDTKSTSENFIPTVACAKSLEDVLKIDYESDTTVLHERLNGKRLWSAVESNPARGANAELLQHFFSKVLGRLNSGKGRKSEKKLDAIGHWRPLSEKLQRHEECARGLLDLLEAQSLHANQRSQENPSSQAAQTPSRRRLTRKMSSLEATEESFVNQNRSSGSGAPGANPFEGGDQDGFVSLPVAYRYKLDGVRTRRYADGHSVQNLGTAWQAVALADTIDLDIENCCFTLLLQVLEKVEPQHESWPSVKETLRLCATQRKHVIETKLKLTLPEGKFVLQKVLNGGLPPDTLASNAFIQELQRASLFCRWVAATLLKDTAWPSLVQLKEKPDVSVLTYFWNIVEDLVVESWIQQLMPLGSRHMSLHFDGIRVDHDVVQPDVQAFCRSCASAIQEDTGFTAHIRPKERHSFRALLKQITNNKPVECPEVLRETGNCILAALHHLGFQDQASSMASMTDGPEHVFFRRRQQRRYTHVAEKLKLQIFPRLPPADLTSGQKVLLHLATDGNPHCVAMETLPGQEVCVTDVTVSYTFSLQHLSSMLSDAIDRKYIILFYVNQKPDKSDNDAEDEEYRLLLETLAGGNENDYSGGADEEEGDVFVRDLIDDGFDGEQQQEDGDDESITHVGDELLALMKKEVTTFLRDPAEHIAKQGCQACPFCPFRQWPKGRVSRLVDHVRKYHSERKQFVASGTKQLKLVISLHDFDQTAGHPRANYLSRSAAMLRRTVDPPLQSNITDIDRYIRLVFTERGPEFWNASAVKQLTLRRVRNLYYTRGFAQIVFQEMLLCNAKAAQQHCYMQHRHGFAKQDMKRVLCDFRCMPCTAD